MLAAIDLAHIYQAVTIVSSIVKDHINPTYNLTLDQHQLTTEQIRGDYRYRFARTYKAPVSAIVGTPGAVFLTRWDSATREDGGGKWTTTRVTTSDEPFEILGVGRRNQTCGIAMPDGGQVSLGVYEDFMMRLGASIAEPSALLSTYGGYCRVGVVHPDSHPAVSACTGRPDFTGPNAIAKSGLSLPMDGPFHLRPAVRKPGSQFSAGSFVVFRPSRVNWEYWDSAAGFGPVVRHEAYCPAPAPGR